MSIVDLIFVTVDLPLIQPDWSVDIKSGKTLCSRIAISFANIL
jgi:hypothetical protein